MLLPHTHTRTLTNGCIFLIQPAHNLHNCRSTKDPGQKPFSYEAGVGQVITGWDQDLMGMKLGEEREILIPAHEGYGAAGFPAWGIPPGGTLNFTLELLSIA